MISLGKVFEPVGYPPRCKCGRYVRPEFLNEPSKPAYCPNVHQTIGIFYKPSKPAKDGLCDVCYDLKPRR